MYEPNEPHDEWGRPLPEPTKQPSYINKARDVFFYTFLGLFFLLIFGWILIIFLPYYFGKAVWEKFELWYLNRLQK